MRWLLAIYFLSGACSLIDQVVWVRLLKLTLGNTVYAASIVVSVFLGGLALGSAVMGRYADRVEGRLRLYAWLELLITFAALAFPFTLALADRWYVSFYQMAGPSHSLLVVMQVVVSACLLLPPTMLMGSTLPLLGRLATATAEAAGSRVGRLYAANTLGAAAGCYLAGFWLVSWLGVMGALYLAAVLNLAVSATAYWLSRRQLLERPAAVPEQSGAQARPHRSRFPSGKSPVRLGRPAFVALVAAFFASGLVSIGYEILWMRSVIFLLGGFTYVFSAVLTVYLLGNVIGTLCGSWLASKLRSAALGFAVSLLLLGVYGVTYHPLLLAWSQSGYDLLRPATEQLTTTLSASPFTVEPLLHCTVLFLIPATLMGIGFPLALQAWSSMANGVGQSVGRAYAANTIGAVIGGLLTGFGLLPLLGAELAMRLLGTLALIAAAGLAVCLRTEVRGRLRWSIAVAALLVVAGTALSPERHLAKLIDTSRRIPASFTLVDIEEGLTTTVSVHRDLSDRSLHLFTSGQSIAGDNLALRADQKALGHFGPLLHDDAQSVLSIGFGSGETTKCLAMHGLDRLDCVEIAPEVVQMALANFSHLNLGAALHDQVNMIYMDAKNYLHLCDVAYDLIVNDSIHPRDFADNASLYGREFYEAASRRLAPGGLMVTWLPTYHMPWSVFRSILGTTAEVFPHVTLWFVTPTYAPLVLVVASNDPQCYSPAYIEQQLAQSDVGESLMAVNIRDSHDLLSCFVIDRSGLLAAIGDYRTNSDSHPFVEFTTDEWADKDDYPRFVQNIRTKVPARLLDVERMAAEQQQIWIAEQSRRHQAVAHLLPIYASNSPVERYRLAVRGLAVSPRHRGLQEARRSASRLIANKGQELIDSGQLDHAQSLAVDSFEIDERSACGYLILSRLATARADLDAALKAAAAGVHHNPTDSAARVQLGSLLLQANRRADAIALFRRAARDSPQDTAAHVALAQALLGNEPMSREHLDEAILHAELAVARTRRQDPRALGVLGRAYATANRDAEAVNVIRAALPLAVEAGHDELATQLRVQLRDLSAAVLPGD